MVLKPLSDLIQTSLQSNEAFPVDFEEAWRLSGYPTRRGALKKLTDNFVEKLTISLSNNQIVNMKQEELRQYIGSALNVLNVSLYWQEPKRQRN
jgi:hypothetical protein